MGRTPCSTVLLVLGLCLSGLFGNIGAELTTATNTPRQLSEIATAAAATTASEEKLTTVTEQFLDLETNQTNTQSPNSFSVFPFAKQTTPSSDTKPTTSFSLSFYSNTPTTATFPSTSAGTAYSKSTFSLTNNNNNFIETTETPIKFPLSDLPSTNEVISEVPTISFPLNPTTTDFASTIETRDPNESVPTDTTTEELPTNTNNQLDETDSIKSTTLTLNIRSIGTTKTTFSNIPTVTNSNFESIPTTITSANENITETKTTSDSLSTKDTGTDSSTAITTNSPIHFLLTSTTIPTTTTIQVETTSPDCDIPLAVNVTVSDDEKDLLLLWKNDLNLQADLSVTINVKPKDCTSYPNARINIKDEYFSMPVKCLNTKYVLSVAVVCEGEISGKSTNYTIWTPPEAPKNLKVVAKSQNSLSISWEPPPKKSKQKQEFRVQVNEAPFLKTTVPVFRISNLTPNTEYKVKVSAKHGQAWSKWSDEIIERTLIKPLPPILTLGHVTQTSIEVQWLDYNVTSSNTLFKVQFYYEGNTTEFETQLLSYTIGNLESYTKCSIVARAKVDNQTSSWSKEVVVTTLPEPPSEPRDLRNVSISNTSIILEWKEPAFVQEPIKFYLIEWIQKDSFEESGEANTTELTYTIKGLQPFMNYSVEVYAVTETLFGNVSLIEVTTDIGLPTSPENPSITNSTNTSISIRWEDPLMPNGPIEYYSVRWVDGKNGRAVENTTRDKFFTIQGLQPYSNYSICIKAATRMGEGKCSPAMRGTTGVGIPSKPRDVKSSNATTTSVEVCWLPPDPFVGPISSYRVEMKYSNGEFREIGITYQECYEIAELEPYTSYSMRVVAVTEAGESAPSNVITVWTEVAVPSSPRNVTVVSTHQTNLTVCWEDPFPFVGPVLNYAVEIWKEGEKSKKGNTKEKCFTFNRLLPYTLYRIQVQAETKAGKGPRSKPIDETTAIGVPTVPRNLKRSSQTNTSISVFWTTPERPNGPQLTYTVHWSDMITGVSLHNETQEKNYTIQGLSPFTVYSVKVRAFTSAGVGLWTVPLEVKTDEGVPSEPRNVYVSSVTNTSAKMQWLPPSPEVGDILSYSVQSLNGDSVNTSVVQKTGLILGDLQPYTNYTVQVKATTKAGDGTWSEGKEFRTLSGVPSLPGMVTATTMSNTTVKLEWLEPSPFYGPIESYAIQIWSGGQTVRFDITSERNHMVSELTPDTKYSFQVQAKTDAGSGPWSKKVEAKTLIGIPTEPRYVSTSNMTAWSVSLIWQSPRPSNGPIEKYTVQWGVVGEKKGRSFETRRTFFEAESLTPYTKYYFRVSAATAEGQGPYSKNLEVQTDIAEPSAPTNLTSNASSPRSLLVSWKLPDHPNGPLLQYRVHWWPSDKSPAVQEAVVNDTFWTISSLSPYTNYTVRVAASTRVGFGPWTEEVVARTNVAIPTPASISSVIVSGPRSLSVKWQATGAFPGPCNTTLTVYRRPGPCEPPGGNPWEVAALATTQDDPSEWGRPEQRTVERLIPHAIYFVRVTLSTDAGFSVSRDSGDFWTLPDVPGAPSNLKADCSSSSTEADVHWSRPRFPNGVIEEYMVTYGIELSEWHEKPVVVKNGCGEHHLRITGLRPEKKYTIKVRARVKEVAVDGPSASLGDYCELPAGVPPLGEGPLRAWGSGPHSLTIEWWKDAFSEEMGALVNFAILLGTAVGNATNGVILENHPTWSNFTSGGADYYQTTPLNWNPFNKDLRDPLSCDELVSEELKRPFLRCTVGIGNSCYTPRPQGYCNGPLKPETTYGLKLVAFTRGGFAETDPIFASTGSVPSSSWIGGLVGSFIVLLLVGSAVAFAFVLKRKGKLQHVRDIIESRFGKRVSPPLPPVEQVLQMETVQLPKSLTVQNFAKHVRIMMSDSHLRFSQEFEALKCNSPKFPCTIAEMEENRTKNRWLNIFPFDHSRVKLLPLSDDPTSDYINANYIPGHSSLREYIATQGPLASTVDDFWRLVWEQSVCMVVMLTQCVERGKNKCEQYWPSAPEAKHYGDLQVRALSESMLSCYTIRLFHLQLGSQERRVKQLHFTHWPDFGCPENPEVLINFVRAVRDHLPRHRPGPILVHCSAGVGRTGTFIAVDRHAQQLPHTDNMDIYGTVMEMRQHRVNMVQTEDQYIYIHMCIEQLINERNQQVDKEYGEAIYSNIGVEADTGF